MSFSSRKIFQSWHSLFQFTDYFLFRFILSKSWQPSLKTSITTSKDKKSEKNFFRRALFTVFASPKKVTFQFAEAPEKEETWKIIKKKYKKSSKLLSSEKISLMHHQITWTKKKKINQIYRRYTSMREQTVILSRGCHSTTMRTTTMNIM